MLSTLADTCEWCRENIAKVARSKIVEYTLVSLRRQLQVSAC